MNSMGRRGFLALCALLAFGKGCSSSSEIVVPWSNEHMQRIKKYKRLRQILQLPVSEFQQRYFEYKKEFPAVFQDEQDDPFGISLADDVDISGLESEILGTVFRLNSIKRLSLDYDLYAQAKQDDLKSFADDLDSNVSVVRQNYSLHLVSKDRIEERFGKNVIGFTIPKFGYEPIFDRKKKRRYLHTFVKEGALWECMIIAAHERGHGYSIQRNSVMDEMCAYAVQMFFIEHLLRKAPTLSGIVKESGHYTGNGLSGHHKEAFDLVRRLHEKGLSYNRIYNIASMHTLKEIKSIL